MNYLHPVSKYIFGISPFTLPMSVDLRPKCSPVSDQGTMSSCVAFAFIGAMEYLENLQNDSFISLSPQFVYYNERLLEGATGLDSGTYMSDGLRVLETYGACKLSLCPYNEADLYTKPSDAAYADGATRKAIDTDRIDQTQKAVLTTLAAKYPIAFGFLAYDSFESPEVATTGIVPMPDTDKDTVLGGHAMLMVGYDLKKQLFLVRNSWGPDWGINGYCWMPFAYILNPNMANSFYTVDSIDWPETEPLIPAKESFLKINN